jgi:MoaA/NifB/PqqE/SkfB family radical SAM enzyme
MEPDRQIEIQLGHMCNNRCVFCVSGQRTELREAFPIAADPVVEKLREARDAGIEKVTLLGGEPTIQPEFFRVVKAAVELGFREIVIFTNGVKTARGTFVDEVLATGGNFTWRLSFQGGDARAHDRTTKKLGSFLRLVETLQNLHARKQRITVNMCVVRSNFESVDAFPKLLLKYGVTQLHLDMIRPLDAGARTEDEMRDMLPRYGDMVPALERMIAGFPPGFDVNIGNLPYCIAPGLAAHIHHDGNPTLTVAVDRDSELSEAWDKYEVKRRDKIKVEACRTCAFDDRCSGVFDTYRRFYGTDELSPLERKHLPLVDREAGIDPRIGRCLARLRSGAPFPELTWHDTRIEGDGRAATVELRHDGGVAVTLSFAVHGEGVRGGYKLDRQVDAPPPGLVEGVRAAMSALRGDTLAK